MAQQHGGIAAAALPRALEQWAEQYLTEDLVPLLASLAAQQREGVEDAEAHAAWRSLELLCEETGVPLLPPPEAVAAAEREQSRLADAALGDGPVCVALAPGSGLSASASAASLGAGAASGMACGATTAEIGTFGSSRETANMRLAAIQAMRFQQPGPGAYSPQLEGRPFRLESGGFKPPTGTGCPWGREDRYKHLARSNRPKGQYTALPLRCGPAPGFYSSPAFPTPKERAVRGDRCQAKLFRPASMLPAGNPPERNRERVAKAREASRVRAPPPTACAPPPPPYREQNPPPPSPQPQSGDAALARRVGQQPPTAPLRVVAPLRSTARRATARARERERARARASCASLCGGRRDGHECGDVLVRVRHQARWPMEHA